MSVKKLPHPLEDVEIPKEGILVVRKGKALYCVCECGNADNRLFLPYQIVQTSIGEDATGRKRHTRTRIDNLRCTYKDIKTGLQCGVTIPSAEISRQVEHLTKS